MGTPDTALHHLTQAAQSLSAAFRAAWLAGDRDGASLISKASVAAGVAIEHQVGPEVEPIAHRAVAS